MVRVGTHLFVLLGHFGEVRWRVVVDVDVEDGDGEIGEGLVSLDSGTGGWEDGGWV